MHCNDPASLHLVVRMRLEKRVREAYAERLAREINGGRKVGLRRLLRLRGAAVNGPAVREPRLET